VSRSSRLELSKAVLGLDYIPRKAVRLLCRTEKEASALKLHYLMKADLFRDPGPEDMEDIRRLTTMKTCPAGKVFYSPNDQGEVLFILSRNGDDCAQSPS
jgi:hypothetical protein